MNRIVHVNRERFHVYMGREWAGHKRSPWHNPFKIVGGVRGTAIERFAVYFYAPEQAWLRLKALQEIGRDSVLGCWCAPLSCHADIVAGYLAWKRNASAPRNFDVTDDLEDAPDGAVVFIEEHQANYQRYLGTWYKL